MPVKFIRYNPDGVQDGVYVADTVTGVDISIRANVHKIQIPNEEPLLFSIGRGGSISISFMVVKNTVDEIKAEANTIYTFFVPRRDNMLIKYKLCIEELGFTCSECGAEYTEDNCIEAVVSRVSMKYKAGEKLKLEVSVDLDIGETF